MSPAAAIISAHSPVAPIVRPECATAQARPVSTEAPALDGAVLLLELGVRPVAVDLARPSTRGPSGQLVAR